MGCLSMRGVLVPPLWTSTTCWSCSRASALVGDFSYQHFTFSSFKIEISQSFDKLIISVDARLILLSKPRISKKSGRLYADVGDFEECRGRLECDAAVAVGHADWGVGTEVTVNASVKKDGALVVLDSTNVSVMPTCEWSGSLEVEFYKTS
jgi:hypothetical protein